MKLIGSGTSPYVRRTRLLLGDRPYEFESLDIYGADRDALRARNPALKIPMLVDGGRTLYDSRVIARYLSDKFEHAPLSWDQENLLTLVDAANDSMVALVLSHKSGLDIHDGATFHELQHERIARAMTALEDVAADGAFDAWDYPAICVYCLVDWAEMREMFDFAEHAALRGVRERHRGQPMVAETDPRRAG
ncbi:glutathione S-transferase [Salinisphaera orenii MK-B5]|uniref:Glutathione S-transferase n=1 Tax=Salinisphaera orenii MK-B5 TaxID=856730 RepID=A0A423PK94_9GAMM|nr:glutathione S-transferase family protein [Salinisphaera orenii]ROO26017.1 glutathione S-transferase [Salinisphaera orenii MK-B5]